MELDYGLDWVQFFAYTGVPDKAIDGVDGRSLLSSMPGSRALLRSFWAHDFFTMSLRDNELRKTVSTTTSSTTTTRVSARRPCARSAWGDGATSQRRSAGSVDSR